MKNKYKLCEDYAIIYLDREDGNVLETYIDLEDFDRVINFPYKWCADYQKNIDSYYARATIFLGKINGENKYNSVFLHKFVMNETENIVDHKVHNTLDNRKNSLRVTTNELNTKNRKGKNKNNTSGYRNVSEINGWFVVQLQVNKKNTVLGKFKDRHEAGRFAKEMREKYYGKFKGKD